MVTNLKKKKKTFGTHTQKGLTYRGLVGSGGEGGGSKW